MPEFIPQHVPSDLDDFTRGYLECMEWLLPEDCDEEGNVTGPAPHDRMEGFHPETIARAKEDCADFQEANAAELEAYEEHSRRDLSSAGHDFFLSRNGHGAGFFDRGQEPCFRALQDAAKIYGGTMEFLDENGLLISE